MRVALLYGVRVDDAGQVAPLFRSHWKHPSAIDAAGYLHPFGGGNNDGGTVVGVLLLELAEGYAVQDLPLDTLHAATHRHEEALRAFDHWLTLPEQAPVREALGKRQPELLIVADSD